jgi:hypothetical protein
MHSITVGNLVLSFKSALISVPRDGSSYDWLCNDWVDMSQPIEITQTDLQTTVTGLIGTSTQKGPHIIRYLQPSACSEQQVIEWFARLYTSATSPSIEDINNAVMITSYPWGKLISLNWGALGYAPGGVEHCILPIKSCAVSLGCLRLDWTNLEVHASI